MALHSVTPEPFSFRALLKVCQGMTPDSYRYEFNQTARLYSLSLANLTEFQVDVTVYLYNPIGDDETTPVKIWHTDLWGDHLTAFLNPYVIDQEYGIAPLPSILPKGAVIEIVAAYSEANTKIEAFLTAAGGV